MTATEQDPFSDARSGFVRVDDLLGRLILVNPKEVIVKKSKYAPFGPIDVIVGDVVVCDGEENDVIENVPSVHDDLQFADSVLTGQLKSKVKKPAEQGGMVLGRVAQQPAADRANRDAWVLHPPTDEDKVIARPLAKAYLAELAALSAADDPFA